MTDVKVARESMLAAVDAMETARDCLKDAVQELDGAEDRDAVAMREACLYAWARLPIPPVESAAARGRRRKA
jgi:hypothetical protein